MAILVPDVGEVELQKRLLYTDPTAENGTLKLSSSNVTPAESDTAGTYTEATFTGYASKTLTSSQSASTWGVPSTSAGVTSSTYGTNQVWSPTSAQTIYLYYVVGASTGILWWAEAFGAGKPLVNGDTLTITPKIEFD